MRTGSRQHPGRQDRTSAAPLTRSLREWLTRASRSGASAPRLRVGACGHLLLSRTEIHSVRAQLIDSVLPELAASKARLSLFVGLAPGADLLFLQTAADWLRARDIDFEMTALLPVPVPQLLNDWVLRARDGEQRVGSAARQRMRAEVDALLACCRTIVPLYPDDVRPQTLASRAFRQHQYRRLAAIIAQHADVVVAILRPGTAVEPGGTAEIIAWRHQPALIPAELQLHTGRSGGPLQTYRIDPGDRGGDGKLKGGDEAALTVQAALSAAGKARRAGNDLLCLDLVNRALQRGLHSRRLDYLRIQALADTGNVARALDAYRSLDLDDGELDEDWLALHGRLEKDLGLREAREATRHFARAAHAYLAAYRRYAGYYSGINAASMLLLSGDAPAARRLARRLLRQIDADAAGAAPERYSRLVTIAEAALLVGREEDCAAALRRADTLLPDDLTRRSRTRQQLLCLCRALRIDPALIEALRLPAAIHLTRSAEIDEAALAAALPMSLRRQIAARALLHLCLRAPADLLLAEKLRELGAHLYLSLPAPAPALLRHWGREATRTFGARLQRLLDAADSVAEQRGFLPREMAWACAEAETTTLGLSHLNAARLGLHWQPLQLRRHGARLRTEAPPPEAAPAATARASRLTAGLLFADFASFRRLDEAMLPRYYREIMTPIGALIARYGDKVRVAKSWGDAIHLATVDAATAAHIAADIQYFIEQRRLSHRDLLSDLELRIAAHFAPAYHGYDPIEHKPTCYGTQLLFTARIEPVAPPGMIYITEPLAARVALEAPTDFIIDYAGEIELAKRAGTYRLFALQRRD